MKAPMKETKKHDGKEGKRKEKKEHSKKGYKD